MSPDTTINECVDKTLTGDFKEFSWIVHKYRPVLMNYFRCQLHQKADVEDLLQEVFLHAFKGIKTYNHNLDFGYWLKGIARNRLLMHFRSSKSRKTAMRNFRNEVVNIVSQNVDTSIAGENSELKEVLDHCINKLPEKMAFVITSGLHGISSNKVAEELCTTVAAVYNLNFRANQLLRKYVSEYK